MVIESYDFRPVQISTDDFPERDRITAWRDFVGRSLFGIDIAPAAGQQFYADVTMRQLPGCRLVTVVASPARFDRSRALVADGNDDISLFVSASNGGATFQRGRELVCGVGDAYLVDMAETATYVASSSATRNRCFNMHVPRAGLAPLIDNFDDAVLRRIPPNNEALRYLMNYVRFVQQDDAMLTDPGIARSAALHLRDLLVLALGGSRDATVTAEGRGLRAARLRTMMDFVAQHAPNRGLTIDVLASRYKLSPRYVQRLFEADGTTFTDYLRNQRLARARAMLADPAQAGRSVSTIALEAGFGDISYFNRRFRRRFGMSPTEFRGMPRER